MRDLQETRVEGARRRREIMAMSAPMLVLSELRSYLRVRLGFIDLVALIKWRL